MTRDPLRRPTWPSTLRSMMVVAVREAYDHTRSPLVWAIVSFAIVLAAFATRVGIGELRARHATYQTLVAQRAEDRTRSGGQILGTQIEPGLRAVRPPAPGSPLVVGLGASMPQFWDFGPAGVRSGQPYLAGDGFVAVDLEFIIRVVLGLLAVLLAIESIAGERANGALLALLGQPVSSSVVLAGKLVGAAAMLFAAVALVVLTAVAIVSVTDPSLVTRQFAIGSGAIVAAGWLYLFTFFAFGQLVSIVWQSYRSALATMVIVWLVLGATGAALPQVVARSVLPAQPSSVLEQQGERVTLERTRRVQMEMGDVYRQREAADGDWTRAERDPAARARALTDLEPVWEKHVGALRAELGGLAAARSADVGRQRWLTRLLALLSPGAQFTAAASNLAGTGEGYLRRWEAAVGAHDAVLNQQLFDRPARLLLFVPAEPARGPGPGGRWVVSLRRGSQPLLSDLPSFVAPGGMWGERLADAAPSLLAMAMVALGLVAAAVAAFRTIRF